MSSPVSSPPKSKPDPSPLPDPRPEHEQSILKQDDCSDSEDEECGCCLFLKGEAGKDALISLENCEELDDEYVDYYDPVIRAHVEQVMAGYIAEEQISERSIAEEPGKNEKGKFAN